MVGLVTLGFIWLSVQATPAALSPVPARRQVTQAPSNPKIHKEIEKLKESIAELTGGIQFSGFFDVKAASYRLNPNVFELGDFEFNIEKSVGTAFQVGAALVFNQNGAELTVGFIDYHLFGGTIAPRGPLFSEKGLHIQVGRFDVPFGLDWQNFASKDRINISAPLTTEQIMEGGYNDVGLRLLGKAVHANTTLYLLRGDRQGLSLGGRVGLTPFNNPYTLSRTSPSPAELGFSFITDLDPQGRREAWMMAFDLSGTLGPISFLSEHIIRQDDLEMERRWGWHISLFTRLERALPLPLSPFVSLGHYQNETDGAMGEAMDRLTLGLRADLFSVSLLKVEYIHFLNPTRTNRGNSLQAQLVIVF